jgi:hypothetical protein
LSEPIGTEGGVAVVAAVPGRGNVCGGHQLAAPAAPIVQGVGLFLVEFLDGGVPAVKLQHLAGEDLDILVPYLDPGLA